MNVSDIVAIKNESAQYARAKLAKHRGQRLAVPIPETMFDLVRQMGMDPKRATMTCVYVNIFKGPKVGSFSQEDWPSHMGDWCVHFRKVVLEQDGVRKKCLLGNRPIWLLLTVPVAKCDRSK